MAAIPSAPTASALPDLPLEHLSLYHATDPYLSSILVFYGPVATANATVSSSRIQAHIFTPAGFQSNSRITISPAAPLYAAVNHLPRERQGDAVCRALAVSMLKYFAGLSEPLRKRLTDASHPVRQGGQAPKLFDEAHAADLANRMVKVEDTSDIVRDIRTAFEERKVPWTDIDVIFPPGTIQQPERRESTGSEIEDGQELQYGLYTPLIQALGEPMFLPTSRLKRAPSQPTNVSKSRMFNRGQKEALRLTMCELVDTEERYVAKIYSLVHEVADEFRQKARGKGPSSTSPDEASLEALFPPCLYEILEVNLGFLDVIRGVLDETEKEAIEDIGQDTELPAGSQRGALRGKEDALGAVAFAKALLDWLPQFSQPYADYMRAHTGFAQTLNSFMKDKNSSFSARVYETGEQRLRSLLMEPVQRLPRYSLLIDTMTGSLPLVHPAVRPLLKARDMVKDICSLDSSSPSAHVQSLKRLRELVNVWPTNIFPEGRLITAVDVDEIEPPYQSQPLLAGSLSGSILLLYQNCLVILEKPAESRTTARGVLADIDNAASSTNDASMSLPSAELKVTHILELHKVRCMQSPCGRILFVLPVAFKATASIADSNAALSLELTSMYEGRASRLIEEISKAKIEGRFNEQEREGGRWTLRSPTGLGGNTNILACVCEDGQSVSLDHTKSSPIRIVFGTPRATSVQMLQNTGLEVIVSLSPPHGDQYRMDVDSVVGAPSTDLVGPDTFIPTLARRIQALLSPLHSTHNPKLMTPLIHSNFEILRYLTCSLMTNVKPSRGFRPPSPSKLISNLLGSNRDNVPAIKQTGSGNLLADFPKMPPPRGNLSRSNTLPSSFSSKDKEKKEEKEKEKEKAESQTKISVVGNTPSRSQENQLGLLEQTFAAYVLSLQSRSGNILGRMLRARENADRAPVNELYNILLEDPSKLQAAAEVPVDTLFVAFETFMKNAWKASMGSVLDNPSLRQLQSQFDTMVPRDFEDHFRKFLADINPQNRRALAAIIKLLSELLDASGNDGDRGALTMAFAEVLTEDGDPVHHVSLLDRLVDEFDSLFEEFIPSGSSVEGTLTCDLTKPSNTNSGSVSSNNSSFRKRFGFGLSKDSTKSEGESKVASILRTLSKRQSPAESETNTPRGSLLRSKPTDVEARLGILRPSSRDRPFGFSSEEQISRPGTGHAQQPSSLSGIQGISQDGVIRPRRKRRSSLSDLRPTTASSDVPDISPAPHRPSTPVSRPRSEIPTPTSQPRPKSGHFAMSPSRGTSPSKATSPSRFGSPIRRMSPPPRPSTPSRKENIDPKVCEPDRSSKTLPDIPDSPTQESKRRSRATSIPQRPGGLRERSTVNTEIRRPQSSSSQRTPKLRMQSPQKLRDRLQTEKRHQTTSQVGVRDEIAALGDELQRALRLTPTNMPSMELDMHNNIASNQGNALEGRFRRLEERFDQLSSEYNGRTSALERDLESSLVFSEKRVKKLDELYREASAENEALYDRFNSELSTIAKDVRAGSSEDAMKSQLTNALEEISRLKKENFRLKREVGGLRAQQAAVAFMKASEQ